MGKQREEQGLLHLSARICNTGLWGNINISLPLEEGAACDLFAMLRHLQRALNNWQVTVAAAGRGLQGQAPLWAAQIPWWGCTLAARLPVHGASSYHVKIKPQPFPGLGSYGIIIMCAFHTCSLICWVTSVPILISFWNEIFSWIWSRKKQQGGGSI